MIPRVLRYSWILLLPILLTAGGCPFSPDKDKKDPPPPPSDYKPSTSIENVLFNLELAYEQMNPDEYANLLDPAFKFYFDPRDIGEDTGWYDEFWGRGEELDSARNMFGRQPSRENRVVDKILLYFNPGQQEVSPENPEWTRVILTGVDLELQTTDIITGNLWILETPPAYETYLHFVQTDEVDPDSHLPIWKIVEWQDKPPIAKALVASR